MTSSILSINQFRDPLGDENANPKSKDCLSVKPARELTFVHSRNKYTADIHLMNKKEEPVLYKIRTTAAKSYVVLPTVGLIPPHGTASIKIHMPSKEQTKEHINDKFLIQAFPYTRGDLIDDSKIMNQVFEQYYKALSSREFQNTKLRVYFENHTVIEEEVSEETVSVKHYSPPKAMTRDLAESSSALFASTPEISPNQSSKKSSESMRTMRTMLSPEPQVLKKPETRPYGDLLTQVLKEEKQDSFRESSNSNNKSDSFRNRTPEPYVRQFTFEKSRSSDQEVNSASQRENEAGKISRIMRDELEQDHPKRNSLGNITNSWPRSFNSFNDNDVSIHTDISDVKSNMSFSEQLAAYKYKLDLLERKYSEQNIQMGRLMQEREAYQREAYNARRVPASLSTTADDSKLEHSKKPQMEIWHLMVLCVVCMILGSVFR